MRSLFFLGPLLFLGTLADHTVITRDGKIHEGQVTREGVEVVVVTAKGTIRLPAISVIADFTSLAQARRLCESRMDQATKLFEEASAKPDRDPMRRRQLMVSIDICNETRDLIEILEKRAPVSERDALAGLKGRLFQFMRLVRDAKGATGGVEDPAEKPPEPVPLERLNLTFGSLPQEVQRPEITDDLGPGQETAVAGLASDQAAERMQSAKALISPPAPHALSALAKAMRVEKDKDALAAIVEALARLDVGPRLKSDFAWAPAEEDLARRHAVLSLARRLPDAPACDLLGDCLRAKPPHDVRMRALFASAFRKHRSRAVEELRETMLKSKDPEVRLEAVRQLGMLRDAGALASFKVAMGGSRDLMTVSFNAIEKTGGVAIPLVMELLGGGNDEVRRLARVLAQRITREEIDGVSELQKWYAQYKRHIDDDEKLFWKEQEENDFPVSPEELKIFDRKLPGAKQP
ncbi:MAG TPA: HEAT repeat domain-containing protein [Planctomycetota bacterium]|nr:HEAT repeat domain-containing protein [Planctomycetota bacterium]